MANYLKRFEQHSDYNTYITGSDKLLPNVSYCEDNDEVHYNPYDPYNGHEYIDLGLPSGTKWATMNVGANSVTDYGNYYMYGMGSKTYDNTDISYTGTENPLATSADTAAQVWGGSWHMPTQTQLNELLTNTTFEWTTIDGVNGGKFTAQNDNYIFLPAAGRYENGNLLVIDSYCYIWSSTPFNSNAAYLLYGSSFGNSSMGNGNYTKGYSVRPVVG